MSKAKSVYICQACSFQSSKWLGKCPSCNEWNAFAEEVIAKQTSTVKNNLSYSKPLTIPEIKDDNFFRYSTKLVEFDRVLGGGLVKGSVVLVGGEPGVGKSTLLLQFALLYENKKVLYVSGEESLSQIKLRASRLKYSNNELYIFNETLLENIIQVIETEKPELVIIDSIQTVQTNNLESIPGSISQIKECTNILLKTAKSLSIPIFLVGHINKEGHIAGPKALEHIVDVVLQFEGDLNNQYRILRTLKNRFGPTSELGIFEMQNDGLREVLNPSELLLSLHDDSYSGTAIGALQEGNRPLLIEVQALVGVSQYGTPQRTTNGFDNRRLNMLLAVLEKRMGIKLAGKDVFLNIAGGIKVSDTGIDLAVICSILSSGLDTSIDSKTCFAGEVSLTGEVRQISKIEQKIKEAEKLGFEKLILSRYNLGKNTFKSKINLIPVSKVSEIPKIIF